MFDNSNVLEYNFTLGDFLRGFFTDFETSVTGGIMTEETPYYKKYFYTRVISETESHYYTAMSYKAPIITLTQSYGNFEDEYKYIYIQTPDFTEFIYNSWSPYSTSTIVYSSYMSQWLKKPIPIFRINDNNVCNLVEENARDIFNMTNGSNRITWSYFTHANNTPLLRSNINLIPSNTLKNTFEINNNETFIIPYSLRNKKELYIQLDMGNNSFGLLLNSLKPTLSYNVYLNYTNNTPPSELENVMITNNSVGFQNNFASNDFTVKQAIQTNIMDMMKKPIQIFISKEKLF